MKAARTRAETAIRKFISDPSGRLQLDVAWVAQQGQQCPPHLLDDERSFLCGTRYIREENTDGRLLEIAVIGADILNTPIHSVNFILSKQAQFVLCRKCLGWLRKQLQPLVND